MKDYVNSAALQEYTTKLVAKLKTLFPGTPTAAATVAEMTDHNKTYVYVGTESGYTAGDWYYWDGTAWTSGGPFQATSIITDTTLAVAGEAADAKATGDAIAAAKTAVLNAMAPAYSPSGTYAVGVYVNHNGSIYRCTTAITTAESWTSGHWTAVVLGADLASQVGELKTQLEYNETSTDITATIGAVTGGFSGSVGDTITFTDSGAWRRGSFVPDITKKYEITLTTKSGLSSDVYYIDTVDENGVILKQYLLNPALAPDNEEKTYILKCDSNDKTVWVKGKKEQPITVKEISGTSVIEELKDTVELINDTVIGPLNVDIPVTKQSGGFSGDIGDPLTLTTSGTWNRTSFNPIPGLKYHITVTLANGLSIATNYVKTTDDDNIIVADYAYIPADASLEERTFDIVFTEGEKTAWVKGKAGYDITITKEDTIYNENLININKDLEAQSALNDYRKDYYEAKIPTGRSYESSEYTEVYNEYDALCTEYPDYITRLADLGDDSYGYPIACYYLNKNKNIVGYGSSWTDASGDRNNQYNTFCPQKTILLTSGVHGNEKSAVWGLLNFVKDYLSANSIWEKKLTNNEEYYIVPVINPWGYNNNSRNNYNDININRDYMKETPCVEAQAVIGLINNISATKEIFEVADCHTTTGDYGYIATRGKSGDMNPDINSVMKIATDTIGNCASRWDEVVSVLGINTSRYPYAYGCLSVNNGTLPHYCIANSVTNRANTVEVIKVTGNKQSQISKMSSDLIGNLLLEYLR